eukprot:scaffold38504_cov17-Prasinocladus_malaysianus.AAC.2
MCRLKWLLLIATTFILQGVFCKPRSETLHPDFLRCGTLQSARRVSDFVSDCYCPLMLDVNM